LSSGFHFAFDSGEGRRVVPARSALSAAVLAVIVVAATLTFGSSLSTFVSHPALYGWNWSYALAGTQGPAAIPRQQVDDGLHAAPVVAAWTTISFYTANLDSQAVPVLFGTSAAVVAPPLLSGHGVSGGDQIVLGPASLAALRQHVGGTVTFTLSGPGRTIRTRLTIVGTATMPTVGLSDVLHTSMGTGALASSQLLEPTATSCAGAPGLTLLAVFLAAGAATALFLTLFASVRRRRRDLAVLKTIGFGRPPRWRCARSERRRPAQAEADPSSLRWPQASSASISAVSKSSPTPLPVSPLRLASVM
jgi:hypothetical protein